MSNNSDKYVETGAEFDDKFEEVHERIDALAESGGGGDGAGHSGEGILNLNLENLAAALEPYLDTGGGRSDEEIRQLIAAYVDENVETGGGGMTQAEVEQIVTASLADLDIKGFDEEIIERVRYHSEALDFPARRVGPSKPIGDYHAVDMWGVKFYTGRECYIRSATVDAAEAGSTTVVLGETDGVDKFEQVDSTKVSLDKGVQHVTLDLEVPKKGYWLLARKGGPGLRRGQWNGWDDHMVDNLQLVKGDKPGFEENNYWYSWFNLEMTANENHEFPK